MSLQSHFAKLQQAYAQQPYLSYQARRQQLLKIKHLLQQQGEVLAQAVSRDFSSRSVDEILFLEILPTIKAVKYCLKNLSGWMKKRKRHIPWPLKPAKTYVLPQPLGTVGIMVPWNYPIFLSLVPMVYALAAGNRVLIKISELTPETGHAIAKLLHESGLNKTEVMIINGDLECAKAFAALPFGHLLFTGSTEVGKQIMRAASNNLTPVTLELGGKSPAIISTSFRSNDLKRLFYGKLANAGQTCIAPDYLLIPKKMEYAIQSALSDFLQIHYPDLMNNLNYSAIISKQHKSRLHALLQDAEAKGARIIPFGNETAKNNKLPVYLLFDVTFDMRIMQEEIFGPLLPVLTYQNFQESIDIINAREHPLALYYFGDNQAEIEQLQVQTLSGSLIINDAIIHVAIDDIPFGGVGASGFGHYHAQEGFDQFSKLKPVIIKKRFSFVPLLYPPYGKLLRLFLSWFAGIEFKR